MRAKRTTVRLAGASALLALGLAALGQVAAEAPWEISAPRPAVSFRPSAVEGLDALSCAECHAEVASEWAASAHGLAWVDELYREEIEDRRRPELCYGCHIPEPLLLEGLAQRAVARDEAREHGVTCRSCHGGEGELVYGPRGVETAAHPTERSDYFGSRSDALCAVCHSTNIGPVIGVAKDFFASKQAERGRSCIGCHMAPVERRWAHVPEGAAGAGEEVPVRPGRSHALQTPRDPAFLRRGFGLALRGGEGGLALVVSNRAGHRIPGLIGREIEFHAELLDGAGKALDEGTLALDALSFLPVDGELSLELDPGAGQGPFTVAVEGWHLDPRAEEPLSFLELVLGATPIPPAEDREGPPDGER